MSATNDLFTRWKAAKGFASDRQAAAALGVSHAGPAQWRAGRNGSAAVIERMANDLGEDAIPVILQAFAEAARDAEDKRALVRMAKKLAASSLALLLALMPYSAPTFASEPALAQSRLEGLYIMRNTSGRLTKPKPAKFKPSRPIVTGTRFRETRQTCCLTIEGAAKLLRVSPRTVQNWEAGRTEVPYSAYKLMRILRGYRLPGDAWRGFRLVGDTLWSPEGLAFKAADHYWWSLTCRMAAEFRAIVAGRRVAQGFLRAVASTGPGGIPYQPDSAQVKPLWHHPDVTAPYFSSAGASKSPESPSSNTGQKTPRKSAQFAPGGEA